MKYLKFSMFIFVLAFLLAACTTPTSTIVGDATQQVAPNIRAVNANATVQALSVQSTAAQLQVDLLNQQSTATSAAATAIAFAPFATGTQVAAELQVQRMYSDATSTSAAATQTANMIQQAYNAQATTTAGVATQVAQVTQQAFTVQVNKDQLALERAQTVNQLKAFSLYGIGIVVMILVVAGAYVLIKRAAVMPNPIDERGKAMPMIEVVEGLSWDIERATNGMIGMSKNFLKALPEITADRQDEVTARAQLVDMQTRVARIPKRLLETQGQGLLMEPAAEEDTSVSNKKFLLPDWDIINGWDGKTGLPYYTAHGLETFDIEKAPHLSVIGATGAGKSRLFFRPLIACALAAGHRVVIIGKSTDYWPFEDHPNVNLIKINMITEPAQAQRYADILEAIVNEMYRRDEVLTKARKSTWARAGYNHTFILCDEFGNTLNVMDKSNKQAANQVRAWGEGLAAEGRKVGFNMWFASQRATGMLGIYSQTRKAIFRVDADEERAHKSLAGASALDDGYYYAKFTVSQMAGGFEPTDEQLQEYLAKHPVSPLESESWIDGVIVNQPALSKQETIRLSAPVSTSPAAAPAAPVTAKISKVDFVNGLHEWEVRVLDLFEAGLSLTEIAESVFEVSERGIMRTAAADLIERWQAVKRMSQAPTVADVSNKEAELEQLRQQNQAEEQRKRADEELKIRLYHEQGMSDSEIVYKVWDKSGAKFKERMARVKEVLGTSSELPDEKGTVFSINNALPA